LVLRWYPKAFRKEYGAEMTQLFLDRRRHERASTARILAREVTDTAVAATTMRWRDPMSRVGWLGVLMAVTIAAVLVFGPPMVLLLIGVAVIAGFLAMRRARVDQPIDGSRRWLKWIVAGALAITPGVIIMATSDEELSELLWSLWALSTLTGIVLLVTGLSLVLARRRPVTDAAT
jgi:hypothetical protein